MIAWYERIGNRIEMKLYENADRPEFEWVKGNVIEGYRYRDGIVHMISDDGRIIWCGVKSGDFRKSEDSLGDFISNADRIRSMSDEELSKFIGKFLESMSDCENCPAKTEAFLCVDCADEILDWLRKEVEE